MMLLNWLLICVIVVLVFGCCCWVCLSLVVRFMLRSCVS